MEQPTSQTKDKWPELLGKSYEEAEQVITAENPNLKVSKLLENSPMTMDLRPDRVRVIVDSDDKVVIVPCIG